MDEKSKSSPHWKGQSRVLKVCHWCAKKQEPGKKSFQACGKCKEVIYCSKECQVASWPLHKAPCKISSEARNATADNPAAATAVANFKKWHSSHLSALRHAAICALDLGHKPSTLEDNIVFIDVKLKFGHKDLPANRRYEPVGGFTMTMAEVRDVFGNMGAGPILDSFKEANDHMRKKGGLGVVAVMLRAHDFVDIVKIILPSLSNTKRAQEADNWGKDWVEKLRVAVEIY